MDGTATAAPIEHIVLDDKGRPCLKKSNFKLVQFIGAMLGQRWTPEETLEQYPDLTLGEIHAALAYYYDHKDNMDAEMQRLSDDVDQLRAQTLDSPLRQKLRAMGKTK